MTNDLFRVLRPSVDKGPKTIIVLGAPRGGTSMVAATLRKLGVVMGEGKLGHQHEDKAFRGEVPVESMLETIRRRNQDYDMWGWKLPNSVYYLDQLLPHIRNPHFIAVFRNPYSISNSAAERDKRDYEFQFLKIAINHTAKVVDLIGKTTVPTALVSFEASRRSSREFVESVAGFIGLEKNDLKIEDALEHAINKKSDYVTF